MSTPTTDLIAQTERMIAAYNDQDFEALASLLSPDLAFAHHNRGFTLEGRDALIDVLRQFADEIVPDRRIGPAIRITTVEDTVYREHHWTGTAQAAVPGMFEAGDPVDMLLCSVLSYDADGTLVAWTDYG